MKKLRRGMIFTVFLSMILVFLAVLGTMDLVLSAHYRRQAASMASLIETNGGVVPTMDDFEVNFSDSDSMQGLKVDEETAFRTRYFTVTVDAAGQVTSSALGHIAQVDSDEAQALAAAAASSRQKQGYLDSYFYSVVLNDDSLTRDIVFLDCSEEQESVRTALAVTAAAGGALTVIVTLVFSLLCGRIIRPFAENEKRQKRFITDASHELKTPLAIISANADVLKMKDGDSAWLDNISDQTRRMSGLIGDLLSLTRAEEIGEDFPKEPVDLVPLLRKTCDSLTENFTARDITLKQDLPGALTINGSPDMLQRLFSVLLENASKYASDHGSVEIKLTAGPRQVTASLWNTAQLSDDFDCSHLFDRFYRPDSSRSSSTGGHGIGLSIAESIVQNHRGSITAARERDGIVFTVTLPKNLR